MITLKEAFSLCSVRDDEVIHLRREGENTFWSAPMTGKEVRNKLDMKKIKVVHIGSHFSWGEYEGPEFEVRGWE